MKMVLYGTGAEHPVQLYNITADPGETKDLSGSIAYADMIHDLTAKLGQTLDFKSVSLDVADYNKKMFTDWYMKQKDKVQQCTCLRVCARARVLAKQTVRVDDCFGRVSSGRAIAVKHSCPVRVAPPTVSVLTYAQ